MRCGRLRNVLAQIMNLQRVSRLKLLPLASRLLAQNVLSFVNRLDLLFLVRVSEAAHWVWIECVLDALLLHIELLSWA